MDDIFFAIKKQYSNARFFHFGLLDISYNLSQWSPEISIQIQHCDSDEIIEIHCKEVYYHGVMDEGFIYMHEEDEWEFDLFIAKAKSSRFIHWLSSYTLLGAKLEADIKKLHHYRVTTRNHFVEIVTAKEPEFSLKQK